MHFVYETHIGGLIKVYVIPSSGEYQDRQIVAEFCGDAAGMFGFLCFRDGVARAGGTVRAL